MFHSTPPALGSLTLAVSLAVLLTACGGGSTSAEGAAAVFASTEVPSTQPAASSATIAATDGASALAEMVFPAIDAAAPGRATALAVNTASSRELEVAYLNTVVSPNLVNYAHLDAAGTSSLEALRDGAGPFLGLRTYQGQPLVNSGVRAEVSVDYPFVQGKTVRYSWRFGIRQDFISDSPNNRWWLFGDLHDQPNPNRGETWTGFPAHSPSVGFGYGQINGQDYLALLYGVPNPATVALIPFARGVWHSVVAEITWSQNANGRIALYLDGSKTPVQTQGANMYNDYQHYLKLGSYRDPGIAGDTWVYVRDVKIETLN
ncbi:hypothetical protein BH11PSE10_BH11PSE10_05900 [soil metagenome]